MYFVNCVICGNETKRVGWEIIRCKGCGLEILVDIPFPDEEECIQQWNDKQTEFAEHIVERFAQPIVKTIQQNHVLTVGWKFGNFERRTKADLVMDLLTGGE